MAERKTTGEEPKKRGSIEELWGLVEGIETAMLTTRRRDGYLVSRPMATQKRSPGADFWFVTSKGLPKLEEIAGEPRVNLSYYRDRTREWVSVSGEAEIVENRGKIRELWAPDWKIWFEDEGGNRNGSAEDPRIVLIGVHAKSAQYMSLDKPQAIVLFDILKSKLMGTTPEIGPVKRVTISKGEPVKAASSRTRRRSTARPAGRRA